MNVAIPLSPTHPYTFLSTVATSRIFFFFLFNIIWNFNFFIFWGILFMSTELHCLYLSPHSNSFNVFPTPSGIHNRYFCNYWHKCTHVGSSQCCSRFMCLRLTAWGWVVCQSLSLKNTDSPSPRTQIAYVLHLGVGVCEVSHPCCVLTGLVVMKTLIRTMYFCSFTDAAFLSHCSIIFQLSSKTCTFLQGDI